MLFSFAGQCCENEEKNHVAASQEVCPDTEVATDISEGLFLIEMSTRTFSLETNIHV